ncbi:MAG: 2-oxoacid ferredoxin oxidoreductase [Candidatus Margulisbacteria bacterium]|nr:2-oxoacid ferredoxin oxidoreductase [Candidatus Margulisiibacteriota bacterium]
MDKKDYDPGKIDIAWCPGCGNFGILNALKQALAELEIEPQNLVIVSGIGQAAKIPHYLKCNFFNGLHGRALPPATGIKASNPGLVVIAESGDGDMYGEGGNHFIHTIRRNPDITCFVHNNMVYGLTKGQASPTSQCGFKTPVQVEGVSEMPFNPIAMAIAQDASFVARTYIGNPEHTVEMMKKAIQHRGFALVDIFQPCVSFNKVNTYAWFKENTYFLEETHDPCDRVAAFKRAIETEKLPLGIFYVNPKKTIFEKNLSAYAEDNRPLFQRNPDKEHLLELLTFKKA